MNATVCTHSHMFFFCFFLYDFQFVGKTPHKRKNSIFGISSHRPTSSSESSSRTDYRVVALPTSCQKARPNCTMIALARSCRLCTMVEILSPAMNGHKRRNLQLPPNSSSATLRLKCTAMRMHRLIMIAHYIIDQPHQSIIGRRHGPTSWSTECCLGTKLPSRVILLVRGPS